MQIGHLVAPSISLHFPDQAPTRLLTFGTVDGPAPPEHLRCSMAQHDTYAQAVVLSWVSSNSLARKRRREANQRLRKHDRSELYDPRLIVEDEEIDNDDDEIEFGSSSSENSEDDEDDNDIASFHATSPEGTAATSFLDHDEMVNLVYSMDTTKLRDLETIESEVAKAAARPVKAADYHIIEMRVISQDGEGPVVPVSSLLYDQGDSDFVAIAKLSQEHRHFMFNISPYPNCCLQFRIRAATNEGIRGEPSVVLAFFTPQIFSHECSYKIEKEPFASRSGLFYLLGTAFGTREV